MKISRSLLHASVALVLMSGSLAPSRAAAQPSQAPDNSAQNKNQGATADSQIDPRADRMTLAQVRKAIIADKSLSTYGHNVKILVVHGQVTLKGPVKSDDEKQKIGTDVASVVSPDKIANQLTVKQ